MHTISGKNCRFFVKPIGIESNERLVDVLGHDVYTDEQQGQESKDGIPKDGYEVSMDRLVTAFESTRRNSGLKYEFFVRINGVLNPIVFVPDERLSSVDALANMTKHMLERLRTARQSPYRPPERGVMPYNASPRRHSHRSRKR